MSKNLVIVESPAKAKTIEKYLGADFKVSSSYGHISDLPSKEIGIDIDNDFKPKYIISSDKKDVVKQLKKQASAADTVWLASDEDREGEAIAWHLFESLKLDKAKTKRIVFREITKKAILKAIENPREINYDLVNAQQARRIIDRLVGFEISPILWRKVKGGLSAGRVQSVAVRLLVDRENEINNFVSESSFKIAGKFSDLNNNILDAQLSGTFDSEDEAKTILEKSLDSNFSISSVEKKPFKKSSSAPFTTSTLQQEASRKLGFSVSRTMSAAQRLYESGNITYMRTDSVNLSDDALNAAEKVISKTYGDNYHKKKKFSNKNKGAQEAHEAIRPTNFENRQVNMESDQVKLYNLIWLRTIASQMSEAILERTILKISSNKYENQFTCKGEIIQFDGFLKVYIEGIDNNENEDSQGLLPNLQKGDTLSSNSILATEKFSRPPYRYSEASLVKKLEELGIGRPSTYAPTITTIQNRKYVVKGSYEGHERKYRQLFSNDNEIKSVVLTENTGSDKGKLVPTEVGIIVTGFLVNNFKDILNYNFTASVEQDFDKIANGDIEWTSILKDFYGPFHKIVEDVRENAERESGERILGEDPVSGRKVSVRLGKFGPMAQIGTVDEEEKPIFAGLLPDQKISTITFEETLQLFKLPCYLGDFEDLSVESNAGRFGPYVKHNNVFVSLPKGLSPLEVSLEQAVELILEKRKIDAPIANYEGFDISKGKGRFGPFIKWNGLFINVNKSYDFDTLSEKDCFELIELKKKKEAEKLLKVWDDQGIRLEKARWGRFNLIKGKVKIEFPKGTDLDKFNDENVSDFFKKKKTKKSKSKKIVMVNSYLSSISKELLEFKNNLSPNTLGSNITLFSSGKSDYSLIDIAIIGINEYRNSDEVSSGFLNLEKFRKEFYSLFYGNWSAKILDLGNVISGESYSDTYFAIESLHKDLINQNIVVVFIGGGQDFTFSLYKSLSKKHKKVNICSVDNKFDFGKIKKNFSSSSYMSKIIMEKNNSLNHFCNLGYQTFLNSQEEMDLLNKFNFEFHRLGEITDNIKIIEPVLSETNLLTVDFKSIKASELNFAHNYPNGFESNQLCSILRYAGMSNNIDSVGFFELLDSRISSTLLSQSIWYFIEGYSLRVEEDPSSTNFNGNSYNVICEGTNLKFYNSKLTQKWWVEFIDKSKTQNASLLFPCSKRDYLMVCDEILSDRLLMLLKREFV